MQKKSRTSRDQQVTAAAHMSKNKGDGRKHERPDRWTARRATPAEGKRVTGMLI